MESEVLDNSARTARQMVVTLQARRDTLEAKIQERTQELRSLCIREAELTGVLPPETPLELGETPPVFRRRVGTAFAYPENLINCGSKLKTKEEETLTSLELDYKIQKDIADAALGLANNGTLSKTVRRKHRQVYQKLQPRLIELETKLNILRLSRGQINKPQHAKQRKKPRPPLDNESETREHDPLLLEEGISLSPLGPVQHELESESGSQRYWDPVVYSSGLLIGHEPAPGIIRHSATYNGLARHSGQENKMMYLRHGPAGYNPNGSYHYHTHPYTTLATSAHPELELLARREKLDQGPPLPGYWLRYETDENIWYTQPPRPTPSQHVQPMYQTSESVVDGRDLVEPLSRQHSSSSTSSQPRWNRERDRFGSLDRRKPPTASHSSSSPSLEAWGMEDPTMTPHYPPTVLVPSHTETRLGPGEDPHKLHVPYNPHFSSGVQGGPGGGGALLPSQTYPEHSLGMDSRGLVRTQSLGSVETSASVLQSQSGGSSETRSVKDLQMHGNPIDTLSRKQKEKEWYETSLDSAPPSRPSRLPSRRPSGHSLSEMKIMTTNDASTASRRSDAVTPELPTNDRGSDVSSNLSRSSSNVSNEQRPHYLPLQAKCQEVTGNEGFDTVVPFESPKNHMVVQAGKWQPYREVSKPFEMADFYKYSTKFRKNGGHPGNTQTIQRHVHPAGHGPGTVAYSQPHINTPNVVQYPIPHANSPPYPPHMNPYSQPYSSPNSVSPTPQQKGIYQPLQPMTCQPVVDPSRASSPNTRTLVVSPNTSLENRVVLASGESLADAFSNEMLAWYQDQSTPRSATLV